MLIKELSQRTGLTPHTIRFYEKLGLIKGQRNAQVKSNNYFHYDEEIVEKLELINDAKSIGFTLSEIAQLVDVWYNNKITIPEKLEVLDAKLQSIDDKIAHLKSMKKMIKDFKKSVEEDIC